MEGKSNVGDEGRQKGKPGHGVQRWTEFHAFKLIPQTKGKIETEKP